MEIRQQTREELLQQARTADIDDPAGWLADLVMILRKELRDAKDTISRYRYPDTTGR